VKLTSHTATMQQKFLSPKQFRIASSIGERVNFLHSLSFFLEFYFILFYLNYIIPQAQLLSQNWSCILIGNTLQVRMTKFPQLCMLYPQQFCVATMTLSISFLTSEESLVRPSGPKWNPFSHRSTLSLNNCPKSIR